MSALGRDDVLYVLNRAGSDISPRMSYKRVSVCTVNEAFHGEFSHGGTEDWRDHVADLDCHRCRAAALHFR